MDEERSKIQNAKPETCFFAVDDGAGQSPVITTTTTTTTTNTPGALGIHDVGGVESLLGQKICVQDCLNHQLSQWELQTHALVVLLVSKKLLTVDELRRGIEYLPADTYCTWGYYDKWAASTATCLLERQIITPQELDTALGFCNNNDDGNNDIDNSPAALFTVGQRVRVKKEKAASRWRKPHLRTPGYLFGARGVVQEYSGYFPDAEFMAFRGGRGNKNNNIAQRQHTYRVGFLQSDLWPEYTPAKINEDNNYKHDDTPSGGSDMVYVEIFESWLDDDSNSDDKGKNAAKDKEALPPKLYNLFPESSQLKESSPQHEYTSHEHHQHHHHHHEGHDDHRHLRRDQLELLAVNKEGPENPGQRVAEALLQVLNSKQLVTLDMVRQGVEKIESLGSHAEGPRLVARAWTDPEFKNLLLSNAEAAVQQLLGISASNTTAPTVLTVVESTPTRHNLVVCTLCSCYPLSILGLSPAWYKSRIYRARAVREPRKILADSFGVELPPEISIHVHDSTADRRYMVLPLRPDGTEDWTEDELCSIVTRDCMIGVAVPKSTRDS